MQDIVSIIVTFYNGDKYLKRIKDYCESNNSNLLKINKRVELVLVNDNPEKKINSFCMGSISFDMMVINNQCNIGTHGSRIEGLKQCRGDYVIFLDQDDYISDIALFEMVSHISDYDALIANGTDKYLNEEKRFYKNRKIQEIATKIQPYLYYRIMTLTGNTLLRKDAIPSAWKKYKMRINGADDELLFIGMLLEKKKFMTISNITFFHVITGENQSANLGKMICSSLEAYDILIREYPQHTKQLKIFYNRKKIAFYRYQRYMFRLFMALILNIKIVIHVILYKLLERI